jgi:hypothetical protein
MLLNCLFGGTTTNTAAATSYIIIIIIIIIITVIIIIQNIPIEVVFEPAYNLYKYLHLYYKYRLRYNDNSKLFTLTDKTNNVTV